MATTKMTNKTALETAISILSADNAHDEVVAKLQKMLESLEKKSSKASGEPTKAQKANLALAEQMLEWMEEDTPYTISELSKNCPAVLGATPQKIRPLLTGLISAKAVVRTEEKGKPIFTKVAVED